MRIDKDLVAAVATPLVLAILAEERSYGYAILARVRELSGGELAWSDGMLYPLLHRLQSLDLLAAEWGQSPEGRRRRYYALTDAGRRALDEQRSQWATVTRTLDRLWRSDRRPPPEAGLRGGVMVEDALETRIAEWRTYVGRTRIAPAEADELESHLRDGIAELRAAGLDEDEAFLVGMKRLGAIDALSREFARTNSARLWKQLVAPAPEATSERATDGLGAALVIGAIAAAVFQLLRILTLGDLDAVDGADPTRLVRNLPIIPVAAVAVWLSLRRRPAIPVWLWTLAPIAVVTVLVNVYPLSFSLREQSGLLVVAHSAIALWLLVGVSYTGASWRSTERRMDFVRFTGEGVVYYALLAIGGAVLLGLTSAILIPLVPDLLTPLTEWVVASLAIIAFPFAAWLVELKQSVIENIAPVLTRIFTPIVAVVTVAAAFVYLVIGIGRPFDRNLVVVFDALLVLVLCLLLYNLSARSEGRATRFFDVSALVAIVGALLLDAFVLADLVARIGDYGWTPNRVAAIGLNVLLVAVLAVAAVLGALHLAGRRPIRSLERWLMASLPAYSAWAGIVVLVVPPVFGFV